MNYPKPAHRPALFVFQSGVHRAHRQAALFVERECRELGLTGPEAHLLGYIQAHEPCPLAELIRVFGHKRSTLTGILDRFEDEGLLFRELARDDRRSFQARLTVKGRRTARVARAVAVALERAIAARVSRADHAAFERVLEAFAIATGVTVRPVRPAAPPREGGRSGRPASRSARPNHRSSS